MKIRFGLQLDGQRGWHSKNSLGEITVGMNGMLDILETQLGLVADLLPQARRIAQYLDCLKKADHAMRFYHNSLEADELGTAATLLTWRDTWHLHGWTGRIDAGEVRLTDMAEVELLAQGRLSSSEGERLAAIVQMMEHRSPAIRSVTLVSALAHFPKRWQQVLSRLPVDQLPFAPQSGELFLHTLQDRLQRAQAGEIFAPEDKLTFKNDGSMLVVRAETRLLASCWLADRISRGVEDGVLVAADALLDEILVAAGEARHGMNESSAFRPALQLLPMALALLWAPLDFNVLTSFLSHPISPVRGYARRKLAAKFADQPGIGGAEWEKVLNDIAGHYGDEAAEVHEQITSWVDHLRFDRNCGVPLEQVMVRARKLAHYFHVRLIDQDEARRASWHAGFSQTSAFISALEQLQQSGMSVIRQRQLQKLLIEATARGSYNPKLLAETGAMGVVNDPAALIEPFEQVFWWQPVTGALLKSYPWSTVEIRSLAESGVELPEISTVLDRLALDWLRPVFAAHKQLVVVLPPREMEVHPAWQTIESLVTKIPEYSLEDLLTETGNALQGIVPHTPLPRLRRWWQLPENTPVPRMERESFSSLELFLFNPYQWLLRYPAALKASNLLSVSDGFLLEGKLAHALVEDFFALQNSLAMSDAEVSDWFAAAFPQIIATQGAVLLMDGRNADYEGLRYRLKRALFRLLAQIKAASVIAVQPEMELNGIFPGGHVHGYADLVMTNQHGQQAIIDMKWGGSKKYSQKLVENTHLQLGIYAELLRQKTGSWPETGYFILSEAKLFAQHYFPDSTPVVKKIDESTPQLWARFVETYAWRNELLKQRQLEVVLASSIPDEEFETPETGLKPEFLNPAYNDYLTLAGWRQS